MIYWLSLLMLIVLASAQPPQCPKAAKEALAGLEKKMNTAQLARAVDKMLRKAEEEEEDEYEPPTEGEASSSKGVLKKKEI